MKSLLLGLAAALALASCSPPPYPKQYKALEGKQVIVKLEGGGRLVGYLWSDGSLGDDHEAFGRFNQPTRVNWDKVLAVSPR
jgi:hypothetical protein